MNYPKVFKKLRGIQFARLALLPVYILVGILFSGLAWYLSNGLSGNFWFLLWIAPVPVLVISLKVNGWTAFFVSFLAYLIGRLSWFNYLVMVATIVPAVIFTLLLPVVFALIITLSRKIAIKADSWLSVFAFPVLFTTFEFLFFLISPDGTAASIAYSQANVLQVIQVASLTGILGITFLVTLVPSSIAFGWYYRNQKEKLKLIVVVSLLLLGSTLLYGLIRINHGIDGNTVKVGLVVLEEKCHDMSANPDFQKEKLLSIDYVKEIKILAEQGSKLVLLPERAVNINKEAGREIIRIFSQAAIQNRVFLIIGYTDLRGERQHNSCMVINDKGEIIVNYIKSHLVTGLENRFEPGNGIGLFMYGDLTSGTVICKDLDFPGFITMYAKQNAAVIFVPSWDFVVDDWLHSRMAILRSVESGFSEVRAARQGRLTISDAVGRVTSETECVKGQKAVLTGEVSFQSRNTFYTLAGNWFGILNIIALVGFVLLYYRASKS